MSRKIAAIFLHSTLYTRSMTRAQSEPHNFLSLASHLAHKKNKIKQNSDWEWLGFTIIPCNAIKWNHISEAMQNSECVRRTKIIFAECSTERVYIAFVYAYKRCNTFYTPFCFIYALWGDWEKWAVVFNFHIKLPNRIFYIWHFTIQTNGEWYMRAFAAISVQIIWLLFASSMLFQPKENPRRKHLYDEDVGSQFAGYYAERNNNFLWQMRTIREKMQQFFCCLLWEEARWRKYIESVKVSKATLKPNIQNQNSAERCDTFRSGWRNCCCCSGCLCMKCIDYIICLVLLQLHFTLKVLSPCNAYT